MDDKTLLRSLKNIGPTIADRLENVGLKTLGDLKKIGPAKAFNFVKKAYRASPLGFLGELTCAVDELHSKLLNREVEILDAPALYEKYAADYYALFFSDPGGIKLEYVYTPE